ncbi:MAG: HlyD family efflux transporter periplasmic adaptor subunit [Lachnospiraceae bacterium]|nr:HlyD family efflux transporter periplasmic adaptor subunit [Lachnospiraceae bacterium]
MNENGKKKREWVKTAAIIFLAVMLVLTFFSNTIMNYSLPEVATQNVMSGTITAKIRGSGVVESGDPYNVEVKESRKVASVAVKVGDNVEKDQVLIYLEDEESDELKAAREELEKAQADYRNALLSVEITSADIQAANTGMSTDAYRQQITAAQNAVSGAENAVTAAKNEVTAAQKKVDEIQTQYEAVGNQISLTPENNADVSAETRVRDEAKAAWDEAKRIEADAKNELTARQNEVADLEARIKLVQDKMPAPTQSPGQNPDDDPSGAGGSETAATQEPSSDPASQESLPEPASEPASQGAGTDQAATAEPDAGRTLPQSDAAGKGGLNEVSENVDIAQLQAQLDELTRQLNLAKENEVNAQSAYNNASLEATRREEVYNRAEQALTDKKNSGNTEGIINNLKNQQNALNVSLAEARNVLTQKQAELSTQETILADRQKELTDLAARIGKVSGLETAQEAIDRVQKKVDELTEKAIDATIKAPIAGTVTALNVTAGKNTDASTPVAVLQPEGKGYNMSFSVTNEQAKRLSVGDVADLVNAWRYDDVTVTLSNIKPDPSAPGQKKLLTFDIAGNVTAGQTLNVSVGDKSSNYDYIVPNSAVREDNNGKFILIVESKPGPLSTRYIASRVDVEVLASDDTQTAVSAALYGYEFVITTSTKPVEAGKQVRLSENN